jgi:hypothetical protein
METEALNPICASCRRADGARAIKPGTTPACRGALTEYVFRDHLVRSATQGKARLRGTRTPTTTLSPLASRRSPPARAAYRRLASPGPSARLRGSRTANDDRSRLSALAASHFASQTILPLASPGQSPPARNANPNGDPIGYRLSAIGYRLSPIAYGMQNPPAQTRPNTYPCARSACPTQSR